MAKRLLTLTISAAYYGCRSACYALARLLLGRFPDRSLIVLTYHSVQESDVRSFDKQMQELIRRTRPVFADERAHSNREQTVAVTFDDGFQSVVDYALPVLAKYGIPATLFVPTGFLGANPAWIPGAGRSTGAREVVVSADMVRALDRRQVKVGSHTVTHPRLASLRSDNLHAELVVSRRTLEGITGAPVTMLSLPYGSFDQRVIRAAERAGYDKVFANVPVERTRGSALQLVGRVNVTPRDWPLEFELKIQGAYNWMAVAVPAKREILRLVGKVQEA